MRNGKSRREKPTAMMILLLFGGVLILISGVLAMFGIPTGFTFMDGHMMIVPLYSVSIYHGIIETVSGIILVLAALSTNSQDPSAVQNWSIVALAFSVVSLIGGGGFFVGFVLALLGSIFGIAYGYVVPGGFARYPAVGRSSSTGRVVKKQELTAKTLPTLNGEERELYELTQQAGGAIFQADLVEKSGFSKVKVSRILDRLEGRGLIERRRRGMTNMVVAKSGE